MDYPPFDTDADDHPSAGGVAFHVTVAGDARDAFIHDGRRYFVSESTEIASGYSGSGHLADDFSTYFTRLYRTSRGRYFIVVDGFLHPEDGGIAFGRGFRVVDEGEARQWWEACDERDDGAFEVEDA